MSVFFKILIMGTPYPCWVQGVAKPNFLYFIIFPIFHHSQNTGNLLNTTFILDRCHRSWAAVTPVEYESDSYNPTGTSARSKIFAYGSINKESFSNPHLHHCCIYHCCHVLYAVLCCIELYHNSTLLYQWKTSISHKKCQMHLLLYCKINVFLYHGVHHVWYIWWIAHFIGA